jgi:thiol-disulfide isomerase/thioredoxin
MKLIYACLLAPALLIKPLLQKDGPASSGRQSVQGSLNSNHHLSGSPFPVFSYPDTLGNKISLNTIKGKKATLVVFWASWCAPCRKEIPAFKTFYGQYKNKGLAIVSISVDQNINAWKKAVREEKMPWTNVANLPEKDQPTMDTFGIKAVPTMFLLDKDNQILLADPTFEQVQAMVKTL